ncbi:hypothetical protein GGI24_006097, partial [Coemansia furcata]
MPAAGSQEARLVPLTPVPHAGRPGRKTRRPASKVQGVDSESKYSMGTGQSSNIPPSLFGSDQSSFSTPLLSRLPHMSVPSDIASLRTTAPEEAPRMQHQSVEIPPAPAPSPSPSLRDSVLSAVSSPVSVGGRRKQSLVVDARTASSEILQGLQHVKAATPEIVQYANVPKARVLESPAVVPPAVLSAEERRAWARRNPTDRPPLSAESASPMSSSLDSEEMRVWDDKLRRRADPARTRVGDVQFIGPQVAESPALAAEPKTSGGILQPSSRTNVVHRPIATPPASEAFRRDRVNSALATLEGAPVDPAASEAEAPQLSVVTGEGLYSSLAEMDPESVLAASRPVSFRMGRHGSSPLNPYTGASSPAVTGSGSIAPPLPTAASGHKQRAGGRRKSQQQQQQQQQVAQTPLPRRWWRNIKESMYAPIPPLHRPLPPADGPVQSADVSVNGSAGIEGLPARP